MKKRPVEGHSSLSATLPHKNPTWHFLTALSASGEQCAALPYPSVAPPLILVDRARTITKQVTRYTPHATGNPRQVTPDTKPVTRPKRHRTRYTLQATSHNRPETRYAVRHATRHTIQATRYTRQGARDKTHVTLNTAQLTRDTEQWSKHGTPDT